MNEFIWGVYPYITLVLFLLVPVIRMWVRPYTWSTRASSLFSRESLGVASNLMHWGLVVVLIGHLVGLFGGLVGSEAAIQFFFWVGLIGGFMLLAGSALALYRRFSVPEVKAMSQSDDYVVHLFLIAIVGLALYQVVMHRIFGIAYNASSWVASLWQFQPQPELMQSASLITKLHVFLAMTFFAYFPFTKLVHVWTLPVNYLARPYQSMRTQVNRFQKQWEWGWKSDKSWLTYGLLSVVAVFAASGYMLGQTPNRGEPQLVNGRLMGQSLYVSQCARCHGVTGDGLGAGAASSTFGQPPRSFKKADYRFVSTANGVAADRDLGWVIQNGLVSSGMPGFPKLTQAQVDSLVVALKQMADQPLKPGPQVAMAAAPASTAATRQQGKTLFEANCAMCHGASGRGDGAMAAGIQDGAGHKVKPADLVAGNLKTGTSAKQLFLRIKAGIPSGGGGYLMPAFAGLSDQETWSLVHYLREEMIQASH